MKKKSSKSLNLSDFVPAGTIAHYGPDDKISTKTVVAIYVNNGQKLIAIRKWFSDKEIRNELKVSQEIVDFLKSHDVDNVITVDRIIGCPHEEGIDYPENNVCPLCPFWANRNRWTGKKQV